MHRQNIIAAGLLAFVLLLIVVIGYGKGLGPLAVVQMGVAKVIGTDQLISTNRLEPEVTSPRAPEFAEGTWLNSEPLTLTNLRGRVVLVEFWTFGCYNCRNTLPHVKSWDARYRNQGVVVIGVHSPEFESEREIENVRREVSSLGIKYPVVTDNDYATWRAYNVEAWPTIFVLDKEGRIRWMHVGEGAYDETEQIIQKLLVEDSKTNQSTTAAR